MCYSSKRSGCTGRVVRQRETQDLEIINFPPDSFVIHVVMVWLIAVSAHFHRSWSECTVVRLFMCLRATWCIFMLYSSLLLVLLPLANPERQQLDTLTELQTETLFVQLLSYPAWRIQSWHPKTLACLQDRPKKSVFLICTAVRHRCRNNSF